MSFLKMLDLIFGVSWLLLLKVNELFCPEYVYDWKHEMK